jgi:DNA repair protein RadD
MALGSDRKHWLLFCTGIEHAQHIADLLNDRGITANCVTGATPKAERERMIGDFKAGRIQALTNAQVLTTGFDFPAIDLIAMLRPTMSPALYVQMAGRGLRVAPGKADCLVLDFAGVVATHGPITAVQPPTKAGKGDGEAPVKVCEFCDELCHPSVKICPACGSEFPAPEPKTYRLHNDDIMGFAPSEMPVTSWRWRKHTSKTSGKDMLEVTYYGALSDPGVKEYLTVTHEGYAGEKAVATLGIIASNARVALKPSMTLDGVAAILSGGKPPTGITYKRDGKYYRIIGRIWG